MTWLPFLLSQPLSAHCMRVGCWYRCLPAGELECGDIFLEALVLGAFLGHGDPDTSWNVPHPQEMSGDRREMSDFPAIIVLRTRYPVLT